MTETIVETALETRAAAVADVNYPKRIVTVIAMPYEQPTMIHGPGRPFTEIVSRSAFDGVEKRSSQIRAFRDHEYRDVVGKIVGLHPSRSEGLVTEVRMFTTDRGDETLNLCDEGGLDASAGFRLLRRDDGRVWEDSETWERNHTVRRLNRLWLDHLALVPNPAYAGATVLSVRDAAVTPQEPVSRDEVTTPNLDSLAQAELRERFDALNRRWLR